MSSAQPPAPGSGPTVSLFPQATGAICVTRGPDHIIEFANRAHDGLYGTTRHIGKPLREALPEAASQGWAETLDWVLSTGESLTVRAARLVVADADGIDREHFIDLFYEPLADADGQVTGVMSQFIDVTEKARTETSRRHNEEQLRLATEAADVGLWDVDLTTGKLFWSERVRAMYGLTNDDPVTPANYAEGLHPDDRDRTRAQMAAAIDPDIRAVYDAEYRTIGRTDGQVRWVASRGRGIFDDNGTCVRIVGTALDITHRKHAEANLRQLNETLERRVAETLAERKVLADMVASTDVMIQLVDQDYCWIAVNAAFATAFERAYGTLPRVGDNILTAVGRYAEDQSALESMWTRALGGEEFTLNGEFGDPARERRHYDIKFNTLRDRDGVIIGAYQFATDITERVRDQARLAEAEAHLRQAQKIEAIGQLTGGVAHDFNNLLMVISGGLSLLDRIPDPAKRQRILDGMRQASERGASLTKQLLAFSRRQPLLPEPVDLARRIDSMRELLDRTLSGDVLVETRFDSDLWPAMTDPAELELVVLNLCVNARDAMPRGGTISIHADNVPDCGRPDIEGPCVRLSVRDTGTGMSPDVMARAFEPFFTTKDVGKGSGLGLAQVYGFARQSGGAVDITSTPGEGTTFTLLLPRADQTPKVVSTAANDAGDLRASGSVLLVEDDDEVATLVGEMLASIGYDVLRVASAQAALGALANDRAIDLVFSDIMMPGGMNGIELAREIRQRRPGLPILLTSGHPEAARREAEAVGVELLPKPYEIRALSAALARTPLPGTARYAVKS